MIAWSRRRRVHKSSSQWFFCIIPANLNWASLCTGSFSKIHNCHTVGTLLRGTELEMAYVTDKCLMLFFQTILVLYVLEVSDVPCCGKLS